MVLQFLIVMAVAAIVFVFVLAPLRRDPDGTGMIDPRLLADRDRAQLAKDRKLDEIRELRAALAAARSLSRDHFRHWRFGNPLSPAHRVDWHHLRCLGVGLGARGRERRKRR